MKEEFEKYILENRLIEPTSRILCAVSGGIDSMVMTELFLKIGSDIGIAHCNFNLRGEESDADEEFVRQFAGKHGIPFFSASFDTSGFASEKGISIQMAARELRYQWFEEIRHKNGFDLIALAHNMNDNIETFLINLTRGTGLAGLTGMKPRHNNLIRPLLFASRDAITNYSDINDVAFREDRTNADIKYTRNRIRHSIIPVFRRINPSFDTTIIETAERLGEINEIVNAFISPIKERAIIQKDNLVTVKIKEIPVLAYRRTILFELFRPFGVASSQLEDLEKLTKGPTGNQLFTQNWRLIRNRNEIIILPRENSSGSYFEITSADDFKNIPFIISYEHKKIDENFLIPSSPLKACLDADKLSYPLIIRRNIPGDYFYPLGMRSKKKLSDYFIDKKYSIPDKEKCLILESAGQIVWVIGDRIDNRFRITEATRKTLVITVKE